MASLEAYDNGTITTNVLVSASETTSKKRIVLCTPRLSRKMVETKNKLKRR